MRKKGLWKKTCSLLLAAAMVLTAVPVSANGFTAEEIPASGLTAEDETEGFTAMDVLGDENSDISGTNDEGGAGTMVEDPVAQVGEQRYETLQKAINAAGSEEVTIQLLKSVNEDVEVPGSATITLDIPAGLTLTNVSGHTITNYGSLTIQGSGTVDNVNHARAAVYNNPGGSVTLNGGTYTRSEENGSNASDNGGNSYYTLLNHGTMTINSGVTVNQGADGQGKYSSLVENGWQDGTKNTDRIDSIMVINGGTFSGGLNTIKNDDWGNLTINGGEFRSMAQAALLNWNQAVINDGKFTQESTSGVAVILNGKLNDTMDMGALTIKGGTFTAGANGIIIAQMGGSASIGTVAVSGGSYNKDLKDDFYVPGYMRNPDTNVVERTYHTVSFEIVNNDTITSPDSVSVGHKLKAQVPGFSHSGYTIDGWYLSKDCSGDKVDFDTWTVTENVTLYAKAEPTSDTVISEAVKEAIDTFDDMCAGLPEGNALRKKTLATLTAADLKNSEVKAALNQKKVEISGILDTLDQAVSTEDLNNYLNRNPELKEQIDMLRQIADVLFAVKTEAAEVQSTVDKDEVQEPDVPSDIPAEDRTEVQEQIKKQKTDTVEEIIENITANVAVNETPAKGLEEATKGTITEPSVLSVKAVLTDMELEAVINGSGENLQVTLVPKNVSYEVKPYKQAALTNENGEITGADPDASAVPISNKDIQSAITFRLPVPSGVTQQYAIVRHNGIKMGNYRIQQRESDKYVEIASSSFSIFELEFTNDSGYVPPTVYYYKVTFDSQGGSAVSPINSVRQYTTISEPEAPVREGYEFGGWYKDAQCTQPWDFQKDTVNRNLTLYAKWIEQAPEEPVITVPDAPVVRMESRSTNTATIAWDAVDGAEGYTVWVREEDSSQYQRKYIHYGNEKLTYTWKNLDPGKKHFFIVRAWIQDEEGKYHFSEMAKTVRITTKPETADIREVVVNNGNDLKVRLAGAASGATHYAMCWSRHADYHIYKIGIRTVYTTRTMAQDMPKGTYYVKVRAYRQLESGRVYADWSDAVKVVVK